MATVMQFGLSLGLAGAAGVRAYFPLIVIGLLTRFSDNLAYRPPFKFFASIPVLLLLIALAAFELIPVFSANQPVITAGLRTLSGAVVFAGLFSGFGNIGGLLFGGAVALLSYLTVIRLRPDYGKNISDYARIFSFGVEETTAIAGTLLTLLLPWSSYFIWGVIFFVLLRKLRGSNQCRPDAKVRSWR